MSLLGTHRGRLLALDALRWPARRSSTCTRITVCFSWFPAASSRSSRWRSRPPRSVGTRRADPRRRRRLWSDSSRRCSRSSRSASARATSAPGRSTLRLAAWSCPTAFASSSSARACSSSSVGVSGSAPRRSPRLRSSACALGRAASSAQSPRRWSRSALSASIGSCSHRSRATSPRSSRCPGPMRRTSSPRAPRVTTAWSRTPW